MKLYEKYKALIRKQFDEGFSLSRAWFTTFTLSPDFFESYLLPPLINKLDEVPKSYIQFEEVNAALAALPSSTSIKVFHDAGMPVEGLKKTTVNFVGVKSRVGLFHPKLCLLMFKKGRNCIAFIIVGSANIGVDGWGRNKESVLIRKVSTRNQWELIQSFFKGFDQQFPDKPSKLKTHTSSDWSLIHSFTEQTFLERIVDLKQARWKIWSPYFSNLVSSYETLLRPFSEIELCLVPDLVNGKVRMETIPETVTFYSDEQDDERFCHAKVWLSSEFLIIGSHNFTVPALGHENVEISIIEPLASNELFDSVSLAVIAPLPMDNSELAKQQLPEVSYGFPVHLEANHKTQTIRLITDTKDDAIYRPLKLTLPGKVIVKQSKLLYRNTRSVLLSFQNKTEAMQFWQALVLDKQVKAEVIKSPKVTGFGFIQEVETEQRQAFRYSSFDTMITDQLSGRLDNGNVANTNLQHISERSMVNGQDKGLSPSEIGYYQIFRFFSGIRQRLMTLKSDKSKWDDYFWRQPDSLLAIREQIDDFISNQDANNSHASTSELFIGLVQSEFNHVISEIKREFRLKTDDESELNKLRFKPRKLRVKDKKYLRFLTTAYKLEL